MYGTSSAANPQTYNLVKQSDASGPTTEAWMMVKLLDTSGRIAAGKYYVPLYLL